MNSLAPSRAALSKQSYIVFVTTSLEPIGSDNEIHVVVPRQWESVVAGISPLFHNTSRVVSFF